MKNRSEAINYFNSEFKPKSEELDPTDIYNYMYSTDISVLKSNISVMVEFEDDPEPVWDNDMLFIKYFIPLYIKIK